MSVSEKMRMICKLVIKGIHLNFQTMLHKMMRKSGCPLSVISLELQKSDFFSLLRATALEYKHK